MPEVDFRVESAAALEAAAAPVLALTLKLFATPRGTEIQGVALRVQVRIVATQRRYDRDEEERLHDLFGAPSLWGRTLKSLLWANVHLNVPGFTDQGEIDLMLPCTFDLDVAAAKYLYGVQRGVVPLTLLFSGTIFYAGPDGALQISPIAWSKEVTFPLPVATWQSAIEMHYPNRAALEVRRDLFDRLYRYRQQRGLTSWDAALETLLAAEPQPSAKP
jgi:hypothetical protein